MKDIRIAIHQPNYIPWLGYIKKILFSDVFVFLDHVQYTDAHDVHRNWNAIKGANGNIELIVPTIRKLKTPINEVGLAGGKWREKHLRSIEYAYKKAPYYKDVFATMEDALYSDAATIDKLNERIVISWLQRLGVEKPIFISSEMGGLEQFHKQELVVEICKRFNATTYVSGLGAKAYQEDSYFNGNGIEIEYLNHNAFEYPQLWGGFSPNLSALDYFMNCGFVIPTNWKEELEMMKQ